MFRQKSPKKSLARLSSAKTCLPKTRFSPFFGIRFSTMTDWINGHVSYIKQNSFSIATICKRPHVDKMNGAPAGPNRFRIDKKKPWIVKPLFIVGSLTFTMFYDHHVLKHINIAKSWHNTHRKDMFLDTWSKVIERPVDNGLRQT